MMDIRKRGGMTDKAKGDASGQTATTSPKPAPNPAAPKAKHKPHPGAPANKAEHAAHKRADKTVAKPWMKKR